MFSQVRKMVEYMYTGKVAGALAADPCSSNPQRDVDGTGGFLGGCFGGQ